MLSHHVSAALAHERRRTLLAEAEAARRAKQARSGLRPAVPATALGSALSWLRRCSVLAKQTRPQRSAKTSSGMRVRLRDGSKVLIRPVRGSDARLLADGFARLSTRSRQLRFLAPKNQLSERELRYLTEVDHHDHEALGALDRSGLGVGIARYVRSTADPTSAEVAITIVDEWQRRGLGTELLAQLSDRARQAGIERFTALVTADNAAVARLLRSLSAKLVDRDSSFLEYEISLVPDPAHDYGFDELIAVGLR